MKETPLLSILLKKTCYFFSAVLPLNVWFLYSYMTGMIAFVYKGNSGWTYEFIVYLNWNNSVIT